MEKIYSTLIGVLILLSASVSYAYDLPNGGGSISLFSGTGKLHNGVSDNAKYININGIELDVYRNGFPLALMVAYSRATSFANDSGSVCHTTTNTTPGHTTPPTSTTITVEDTHDNGKHNGFDHSNHYGYDKHDNDDTMTVYTEGQVVPSSTSTGTSCSNSLLAVSNDITKYDVGLKGFLKLDDSVGAYYSGGASIIGVRVNVNGLTSADSDSGYFLGTGIVFQPDDSFSLGLNYKYSNNMVTLFHQGYNYGSGDFTVNVAYNW